MGKQAFPSHVALASMEEHGVKAAQEKEDKMEPATHTCPPTMPMLVPPMAGCRTFLLHVCKKKIEIRTAGRNRHKRSIRTVRESHCQRMSDDVMKKFTLNLIAIKFQNGTNLLLGNGLGISRQLWLSDTQDFYS